MEFTERDFFKDKFERAEIMELLKGKKATEMFNVRSPSVKELGLQPDRLNENELIDQMLKEPRLIRRPVVRIEDKVYFGADSQVLETLLK